MPEPGHARKQCEEFLTLVILSFYSFCSLIVILPLRRIYNTLYSRFKLFFGDNSLLFLHNPAVTFFHDFTFYNGINESDYRAICRDNIAFNPGVLYFKLLTLSGAHKIDCAVF